MTTELIVTLVVALCSLLGNFLQKQKKTKLTSALAVMVKAIEFAKVSPTATTEERAKGGEELREMIKAWIQANASACGTEDTVVAPLVKKLTE